MDARNDEWEIVTMAESPEPNKESEDEDAKLLTQPLPLVRSISPPPAVVCMDVPSEPGVVFRMSSTAQSMQRLKGNSPVQMIECQQLSHDQQNMIQAELSVFPKKPLPLHARLRIAASMGWGVFKQCLDSSDCFRSQHNTSPHLDRDKTAETPEAIARLTYGQI
jgi:hypothetical protein